VGGKLGFDGRIAPAIPAQDRMIVLSPDAVDDVARLRSFLNDIDPNAARRAMAAILTAIERLDEFPELGKPTEDVEIRQIIIRFGASGYVVHGVFVGRPGPQGLFSEAGIRGQQRCRVSQVEEARRSPISPLHCF
jgi:toxin ParE1/3/4